MSKQSEVSRLRELASVCYAGLVAECNLPDTWADVFLAASQGEVFTTEELLPFTYQPPQPRGDMVLDKETLRQALHAMKRCAREGSGKAWQPYIDRLAIMLTAPTPEQR